MAIIYTHDKAAQIVEMFEGILDRFDIHVPSPEDDEREEDNMVGLYGSIYSDLLDDVESFIIKTLEESEAADSIIKYEFSGNF